MLQTGMLDVTIEGKVTRVTAGSVVYVNSNEEHGWKNPGPERAQYFVMAIGREGASTALGLDQAGADGVPHHAGGFMHAQLLQDPAAMRIGGLVADAQLRGGFLGGFSARRSAPAPAVRARSARTPAAPTPDRA